MTFTRQTGGAAALAWMESKVGMPYQWGGTGDPSYDCSGLFQAGYAHVGVTLPRTSEAQCSVSRIAVGSAYEPGDGVFFAGAPSEVPPGHVGAYVGVGSIGSDQHSWVSTPSGRHIFFNAPYTGDPHGIRYDYFDPATLLFLTRPANLLPEGPPTPPTGAEVDDQFISKNPTGAGDFLCSWSTRIAVGIPSIAVEQRLIKQGAKRDDLDTTTFAYFKRAVWSKP